MGLLFKLSMLEASCSHINLLKTVSMTMASEDLAVFPDAECGVTLDKAFSFPAVLQCDFLFILI